MSKSTILFELYGFPVHLFGVMLALGIMAALHVTLRQAKRQNLNEDKIFELAMVLMVGGVLGARILYVLLNIGVYLQNPASIFSIHKGGLAFHGAVLAGVAIVLYYAKGNHISFLKLADLLSPALVLGYAIGRIGCDIYGNVTTVPWAVNVFGELRHPVQAYSAIAGFTIYGILVWKRKYSQVEGELFLLFVALYSGYRFLIEFFRSSGGVTPAQIISLFLILGCLVLYITKNRYACTPLDGSKG